MRISEILWVGLGVFGTVEAFEQCYYPDGSIPVDYIWEPCNPGAQFSSCCIPSEGDVCQDNGLCYYPGIGTYRGACTDRTWNDPACPSNMCMTGFETGWTWVTECDTSGGQSEVACGIIDSYGVHSTPTCAAGAVSNTAIWKTTQTTTSAGRYTPPPSLDTSLYSVWTSSYTTIMSAWVQTTTMTTTFESTFTSKIGLAQATTTSAGQSTPAVPGASSTPGKPVTLPMGALIGIIVGAIIVAVAICVAMFFFLRKRSSKKHEAIRLNSASYPPANGPVGADQVHPYEVDTNEVLRPPPSPIPTYGGVQKPYYPSPKVGTYEMDDVSAMGRNEKKWGGGAQMNSQEHEELRSPLRSPAPAYAEAIMPVELDATPSMHNGR